MRTAVAVITLVTLVALTGCPDREEAINQVGGAPRAQVDAAKERLGKAEDKLQQAATEASKATE